MACRYKIAHVLLPLLLASGCSTGSSQASPPSLVRVTASDLFTKSFGGTALQRAAMIDKVGGFEDRQWQQLVTAASRVRIDGEAQATNMMSFHLPGSAKLRDLWKGMGEDPSTVTSEEFTLALAGIAKLSSAATDLSLVDSPANPDTCVNPSIQSAIDIYVAWNGDDPVPPAKCIKADYGGNKQAWIQISADKPGSVSGHIYTKNRYGGLYSFGNRPMTSDEENAVKSAIRGSRSQTWSPGLSDQQKQIWQNIVVQIAEGYAAQNLTPADGSTSASD